MNNSTSDKKIKTYSIKIPVYTSEAVTQMQGLFGGITYNDMIDYVKRKIEEYNTQTEKIVSDKRNKTKKREIEKIDYDICPLNGIDSILLKISAYNTNLYDGFIETDIRFPVEKNHKVGSYTNFVLLFPNIYGIDSNNYIYHWIILVYEDPHKDSSDLLNTVKLVLSKVLNISTANIKLPEVLKELQKINTIPEIQLRLTSLSFEDNEVDMKYRDYLTNSKIKSQKENIFKNMPFESVQEMIEDSSFNEDYQKKEIKAIIGKREYKITKEQLREAKEELNQAAEQIFNATSSITENELKNLYDKDFVLSKLVPVLENYLNSN